LGTRLPPYALLDVDGLNAKDSMSLYTGSHMIPILTDLSTHLEPNFTAEDLKSHVDSVKSHFVIRRLSSPRMKRIALRFPKERADILTMITFLLRGELIVYYGDEIGLNDGVEAGGSSIDVSIGPMNWRPDANGNKSLDFFQCLGRIHSSINQTETTSDSGTTYVVKDGVFAFKREKYVVVANLNSNEVELDLQQNFGVSGNGTLHCATPNLSVPLDEPLLPNVFKATPNAGYVIAF